MIDDLIQRSHRLNLETGSGVVQFAVNGHPDMKALLRRSSIGKPQTPKNNRVLHHQPISGEYRQVACFGSSLRLVCIPTAACAVILAAVDQETAQRQRVVDVPARTGVFIELASGEKI